MGFFDANAPAGGFTDPTTGQPMTIGDVYAMYNIDPATGGSRTPEMFGWQVTDRPDRPYFDPNTDNPRYVSGGNLAGMSEQEQFMAAAQALGIPLNQTRGKAPQIVAWLQSRGITGWEARPNADDWVKTPSGREIDFSLAGSNAFQWAPDSNGGGSGANLSALFGAGPGPFQSPGPAYTPSYFTPPAGFTAPTLEEAQQTPGYQFTLGEGLKSLGQTAAAKGTLLTGGTLKGAERYATNLANTTYQDVFNRSLATQQNAFNQAFSTSQQNNALALAGNQNAYQQALSTHQTNFGDLYNLANLGFQATNASFG